MKLTKRPSTFHMMPVEAYVTFASHGDGDGSWAGKKII